MSSNLKSDVGITPHNRKSEHSLIVKLGKAMLEAKGHGVYVLPLVLIILAVLFAATVGGGG